MTLVVGVDSSTQSCKVQVRRIDDGALVGQGRSPHPGTVPPTSEQDPASWWDALCDAMAQALAETVDTVGHEVPLAAMAVAGQQHGLVALDDRHQVLRPAMLWNDTRAAPDARWLLDQLDGGAASWADACGSVPLASFTVAKLSWLHRNEPDVWSRLAHVALPHDWINLQLTGRLATDRGDASGTGYWSPTAGSYRPDLLAIVDSDRDWSEALATVCAPTEVVDHVDPAVAADLALAGVAPLVAPGTGDNMAAALGLGLSPGDVAISLGTSGTVYAVAEAPTNDPTGAVAGFADATGRFLPLVCTLNATQVTEAVARWLGDDHETLAARALAAPPGAGGVVMVPYLAGERTPDRPDATGTVTGLRVDTDRAQLARAAHEGVVCGLLDGLDALRAVGVPTTGRLLMVGGGSRSPAYQQILADLAGRSVTVADGNEHVALGACVQAAAVATGTEPDLVAHSWGLGAGTTIDPDPAVDAAAVRATYARAREQVAPA